MQSGSGVQEIQWDDYRVAFQVAESGSLANAARQLGCNHTTVLRHVNRLEKALNIKLFIRHQRGYRLTDAGQVMMNEMPSIFREFRRMEELMGNVEQDISGNLRITTVVGLSSVLNPALMAFRDTYPKLRIQLISSDEIIPLASGVVHVSLRVGQQPTDPDLIAKQVMATEIAYYAADSYIQRKGFPENESEYNAHDWVMPSIEKYHIPLIKAVMGKLDRECIVYQSNHIPDIYSAVVDGMGIGLLTTAEAEQQKNMKRLPLKGTAVELGAMWFVYHRDLASNAKVQTLYRYLLESLGAAG